MSITSKLEGRCPRGPGLSVPIAAAAESAPIAPARPSMSLSAGLTRTQARRHLGPGPRAQAAGVPVTRTLWARNPPLGRCGWSRTIRCILAEAAAMPDEAAAAAGLGAAALAGNLNRPGGPALRCAKSVHCVQSILVLNFVFGMPSGTRKMALRALIRVG